MHKVILNSLEVTTFKMMITKIVMSTSVKKDQNNINAKNIKMFLIKPTKISSPFLFVFGINTVLIFTSD